MDADKQAERKLRVDREICEQFLDELDALTANDPAAEMRRSTRHSYRETIHVEMTQPNGMSLVYSALTRNICRDGVAFLVGQFVYANHPCKVQLRHSDGKSQTVSGTILRCRYLSGSVHLYEVAVKFDSPIEISMLEKNSISGQTRILLADDDTLFHRLIAKMLKSLDVELTCVVNGKQAVESALASTPDLVLMDMEMPEMDGLAATRELRASSFTQPIVAVTACEDDETKNAFIEAGCDGFIKKPFTRSALLSQVHSMICPPVVSTLAGDPEMAELIDDFVLEIPDMLGKLEAAYSQNEMDAIERLARQLKGQAGACGFEQIAALAIELEKAAKAQLEQDTIYVGLKELVRFCRAAQPAGKGARHRR